jgi:hypothetical protein
MLLESAPHVGLYETNNCRNTVVTVLMTTTLLAYNFTFVVSRIVFKICLLPHIKRMLNVNPKFIDTF